MLSLKKAEQNPRTESLSPSLSTRLKALQRKLDGGRKQERRLGCWWRWGAGGHLRRGRREGTRARGADPPRAKVLVSPPVWL